MRRMALGAERWITRVCVCVHLVGSFQGSARATSLGVMLGLEPSLGMCGKPLCPNIGQVGTVLGQRWYGSVAEQSLHVSTGLGPGGETLEAQPGQTWDRLVAGWARVGECVKTWSRVGAGLGRGDTELRQSWRRLVRVGRVGAGLGPTWGRLLRADLGRVEAEFGAGLGQTSCILEASWGRLGAELKQTWDRVGPGVGRVGAELRQI
jgi:hypothetical protein